MLLVLSACKQPKTFIPSNTDTFVNHTLDIYDQADKLLQADYVFVLDTSYSMNFLVDSSGQNIYNEVLASHMQSFLDALAEKNIDYRIGFIRGNTHAGSVSTIASSFMADVLTKGSSSASAFSIIEQVGAPLSENTNFLLESAHKTMSAEGGNFIRHAAQLVYAFISDSDDKGLDISTNRTEQYYIDALRSHKHHPHYVSARSYTLGMADNCTPDPYQPGSEAGVRIANVATQIDARHGEAKCALDPTFELLSNIARNVTKLTDRFTLTQYPMPGTLSVQVNGNDVPEAGNWSYDAATNEVIFAAGKAPAFSSSLLIDYEIAFVLSKTPKVDSIQVKVDGASVSKDDTNGWSFVDAENRVQFNGNAKPSSNANISIVYQVK